LGCTSFESKHVEDDVAQLLVVGACFCIFTDQPSSSLGAVKKDNLGVLLVLVPAYMSLIGRLRARFVSKR